MTAGETFAGSTIVATLIAAVLVTASPATFAQASAADAQTAPTAVAPPGVGPRVKPPPRLLTPAEKRANVTSTVDSEARPEGAVKPQVSIPFGRKPVAPTAGELRAVRPAAAATGIDDAAAACDAEIGPQARSACRAKRSQADSPANKGR